MWRGNDRSGRCQYTFTVASPSEASCPQTSGPELEGLKARLSMLEVLVSRLTGSGDAVAPGSPRAAGAAASTALQAALNQAVGERDLLQGEKRRLEQELERLQRRTEEMRRETERLKSRPCPPLTPALPPSPSLRGGSSLVAGISGKRVGSSSELRNSLRWLKTEVGFPKSYCEKQVHQSRAAALTQKCQACVEYRAHTLHCTGTVITCSQKQQR